MLQQFSWPAYFALTGALAAIYYACIGLRFFKHELKCIIGRLTGQSLKFSDAPHGDLYIPVDDVVGSISDPGTDVIVQDELVFAGDTEEDAEPGPQLMQPERIVGSDASLLGEVSEMVSEAKTLVRVVAETHESKENFETLFRLLVQKYPNLAGSAYEAQISNFLLQDVAEAFPFPLTRAELQSYWFNPLTLKSA